MTKITASTTIAELAMIFAKFGIRDCNVGVAPAGDAVTRLYRVQLSTLKYTVVGDGELLFKAFDDAVARLEHRIASEYVEPVAE